MQTYRIAVMPLFTCTFTIGMCIFVVGVVIAERFEADPGGLAAGGAAGTVAGLILSWVAKVAFPVRLSPELLHAHDFWGFRRTIAWSEIGDVGTFDLLWLHFLKMKRAQGGTVYVPLFLCDRDRFRDEVRTFAGVEHPLTLALEKAAASKRWQGDVKW